jgi:membrane protein implicated in regulation of membrane protease activity
MNPLAQAAPLIATIILLVLVVMIVKTVRRAWANHAEPETIRKRQMKDAHRGVLLHRLEEEHHRAAAEGHEATIKRLTETAP